MPLIPPETAPEGNRQRNRDRRDHECREYFRQQPRRQPQRLHQRPQAPAPPCQGDKYGCERVHSSQGSEDRIQHLAAGQLFPVHEQDPPQRSGDEGERPFPQLRHLQPVGEDVITVKLQEWHQVESVVEIGDDRDLEEHRREKAGRQYQDQEAATAGEDEARIGPSPTDRDPPIPGLQPAVGHVDVPRRHQVIEVEASLPDAAAEMFAGQRVGALMDERHDHVGDDEGQDSRYTRAA